MYAIGIDPTVAGLVPELHIIGDFTTIVQDFRALNETIDEITTDLQQVR